jgi:hypothetical protein
MPVRVRLRAPATTKKVVRENRKPFKIALERNGGTGTAPVLVVRSRRSAVRSKRVASSRRRTAVKSLSEVVRYEFKAAR